MERVYLLLDPFHPYSVHFAQLALKQHGLRAICVHHSRKDEAYQQRPAALGPSVVAGTCYFDEQPPRQLASRLSARHQVVGVVPTTEAVLTTAAALLEHLDVGWNSPSLLRRFRDKHGLKSHVRQQAPAVRINRTWQVHGLDEVLAASAQLNDRFVLKPNDGFGSRGVGFFDERTPPAELEAFLRRSAASSFILEEFLAGTEYCVNGQLDADGTVQPIAVLQYERVPANGVPNAFYLMRHVPRTAPEFKALTSYAIEVMQATGLRRSPFHMEVIVDARGPCMVEVGARLAGHCLAEASSDVHGDTFDVFSLALHHYLSAQPWEGPPLDWEHYDRVNLLAVDGISRTSEVLYRVEGLTWVEQLPCFRRWVVKPRVGMKVEPTIDLFTVPWSVQLRGEVPLDRLVEVSEEVRRRLVWNQQVPMVRKLTVEAARLSRRVQNKARWVSRRALLPVQRRWDSLLGKD